MAFVTGYLISVLSEPELGSHCLHEVRPVPRQGWSWSRLSFVTGSVHNLDRISRRSQVAEGVGFGGLRIPSLVFADDVVLFASLNSDLQFSLGLFAAEWEATGMKISTSISEAMVLSQKRVDCPLRGESRFPKLRS